MMAGPGLRVKKGNRWFEERGEVVKDVPGSSKGPVGLTFRVRSVVSHFE